MAYTIMAYFCMLPLLCTSDLLLQNIIPWWKIL